ncbi:hypothetical protein CIPAW_07G032400 [Carya illinoinensis]|uniref:Uncharacterized protein n=1 Tax=Carya illinoinensis TaxID=32201 RepID=A0A8T1PUE0_CARIL|nr:hypothetical protein CIPAW_07G032400 [Carya illinoinensis]
MQNPSMPIKRRFPNTDTVPGKLSSKLTCLHTSPNQKHPFQNQALIMRLKSHPPYPPTNLSNISTSQLSDNQQSFILSKGEPIRDISFMSGPFSLHFSYQKKISSSLIFHFELFNNNEIQFATILQNLDPFKA